MKKIVLSLLTLSSLALADCHYEADAIEVEWEAYKTPAKIDVDGTFQKITLHAPAQKTQQELLQHATLSIDTKSVYSKNSDRDAKLVKFFFDVQNVHTIEAKVLSVSHNKASVAITMNNITKEVVMDLDFDKDEIEAKGRIDLADFAMLPSLKSINTACYDLHKGKTWQDVEIEFEIKTHKRCK
jgi:polyisoprenoid-binding protein YceI